jgi:hypothetical protein
VGTARRPTADGMRLGPAAHRTRVRDGVAQRAVVRCAAGQQHDAARQAGEVSQRGQAVLCHEMCARQRQRRQERCSQSKSLRPAILLLTPGDVGP